MDSENAAFPILIFEIDYHALKSAGSIPSSAACGRQPISVSVSLAKLGNISSGED